MNGQKIAPIAEAGLSRHATRKLVLPRFLRKPYRIATRVADGGFTTPRIFWVALFAFALIGSGIAGYISQRSDGSFMAAVGQQAGFQLRRIEFKGNEQLPAEKLEAQIADQLSVTLFDFDSEKARADILKSPWVREARVFKVYPDIINIEISERVPFAIWQHDEKAHLIAADGTVLQSYPLTKVDPVYSGLPQVVGEDGNEAAAVFLAAMRRYPDLDARAVAYVRVAKRRWDLELENGIRVMLPETKIEEALGELSRLHDERQLLDRDVAGIDMRLPDRTYLKLTPNSSEAHAEQAKSLIDLHKKTLRARGGRPI